MTISKYVFRNWSKCETVSLLTSKQYTLLLTFANIPVNWFLNSMLNDFTNYKRALFILNILNI